MQGKKQYQEKLFVNFQLSERIPEDNFYRRLKTMIDFTFLYKKTAKYYGTEGQKSIDPVVFMKLMLVGYLENLNSDRRIINTVRLRLDILYFIGYDLDEELPWHSTLSRTRQLYGQEVFTAIKETVDRQYYMAMHLRMQSHRAKRLMKERQSTVEPVIGTLVNYLGMKRVNSKGLLNANKCLTMAAVAYNLKKLLKHCANSRINNIQVLKAEKKAAFTVFLSTFYYKLLYKTIKLV